MINIKIEKVEFKYSTDIISEKEFNSHMTLYDGYIKKYNNGIDNLDIDTYSYNGAFLHQLYFEQLGNKNKFSSRYLTNFFGENFGSYEKWKENLIENAIKIKSKGWVVTSFNYFTKSFKNITLTSHDDGLIFDSYPVIILDMYEHAFWFDYQQNKLEYINKFVDSLNWDIIENRIKKV